MRHRSLWTILTSGLCLMLAAGCQGALNLGENTGNGDVGEGADSGAPSPVTSKDMDVQGGDDATMRGDDGLPIDPPDAGVENDQGEEPAPPPEPSGNDLSTRQSELFMCSGEIMPSPARLRLVDRGEWKRNVSLNNTAAGLSPFDPLQGHPYSTFVEGEGINKETLDVYVNMSSVAATAWEGPGDWARGLRWSSPFKNNPMLVAQVGKVSCLIDERNPAPDDACLNTFVTILLEKAVIYRPASDEEKAALVEYAKNALAKEASPPTREGRADTVRQIVQAAWMTTGALFKSEGFEGVADAQGVSPLTDWEIAHALAYALGQSAPGAVSDGGSDAAGAFPLMVDAAKDGTLSDPATIAMLIDAYASRDTVTAAARGIYGMSYGVQQFFREWLGYMTYLQNTKDEPWATTAYEDRKDVIKTTYNFAVNGPRHSGSSHEAQLFMQLDDMIARIVHEDEDVFRKLLTSREYYVASDVGSDGGSPNLLYNLATSTTPDQQARWVTLPATERAGVLTHPAWLASHSLNFENDPNPVHRGKWIRESLLCGQVPDVPLNVEAALDPETKDQSTRVRVKQKTEAPECAGCHALMNPLGYPFEIYNHIGIMRADDHGATPDGSSVLVMMPDESLNGPVRDAVEMSEKLADSQWVKRCFIRQSFRYFMGREETMADACLLTQMEQAYDRKGSFKEMLVALFTSPAFLTRQHAQ